MPTKLGMGGEGQEQYNPNNGKYVEDGIPNKSYDNPDEKILDSLGLNSEDIDFEIVDKEIEDWLSSLTEEELNDDSPVLTEEELEEQEIASKIVKRTDKRKQLPPIWDFMQLGLKNRQIQEDIDCDEFEAEKISNAIWSYTGVLSKKIGTGEMFESWLLLEKYIKKAPKYDGTIYRGLHFFGEESQNFIQQLEIGNVIRMKGISSWTSNEKYSSKFSNTWDEQQDSIILICENKKGVGIQHLSQYGEEEAEVIHSNYVSWEIKKIEEEQKPGPYNKKIRRVYLEEI